MGGANKKGEERAHLRLKPLGSAWIWRGAAHRRTQVISPATPWTCGLRSIPWIKRGGSQALHQYHRAGGSRFRRERQHATAWATPFRKQCLAASGRFAECLHAHL